MGDSTWGVPDLVIYLAGADPFVEDPLGNMNITKEGLRKREQLVSQFCQENNLPVAVILGGGYSEVEDVADVHFGTFEAMYESLLCANRSENSIDARTRN